MSSHIPPELVDQIIDYLHDDSKSLSACALVARGWLPSTRFHRFRSICFHSANKIYSFRQFSRDVPDILPFIQEAVICDNSGYVLESILEAATNACLTLPNLERIKFNNRTCASTPAVLKTLSPITNKITTLNLSGTFLASSNDFWPLICSFPNLSTVQACGVNFRSTDETAFTPINTYEPPIATFSLSASRQDAVIDHLIKPPFPLRFLKIFEIHSTNTHQTTLVPLAESIRKTVEQLRFFAISTQHTDHQRMPDFVSRLTKLDTLIMDRIHVPPPGEDPMRSLSWIPLVLKSVTAPIRSLCVQLIITNIDHLDSMDWPQVDHILTDLESLRGLTEVKVTVMSKSANCKTIGAEALRTFIGQRLPMTSQRGILRCMIGKSVSYAPGSLACC